VRFSFGELGVLGRGWFGGSVAVGLEGLCRKRGRRLFNVMMAGITRIETAVVVVCCVSFAHWWSRWAEMRIVVRVQWKRIGRRLVRRRNLRRSRVSVW
jgi:hypothetical protein